MSLLIFGNQVDLPSDRRCDLRRTLCSLWWKPCGDRLVSGRSWRCHGLWGVADSGLNAQCLRGNSSHVAIVFCPQGGLHVAKDMVFTNAMATFSQCGLANFQPAWCRRSELGKSFLFFSWRLHLRCSIAAVLRPCWARRRWYQDHRQCEHHKCVIVIRAGDA